MAAEKQQTYKVKRLPIELDNTGVIFSYGSLLEHEKLRELFRNRGQFEIFETVDVKDAVKIVRANPKDIVILKNARLENVRVSIVSESILRRWYAKRGGDVQQLVDAGIISAGVQKALFLYARRAQNHEKGRFLNGGLICNLSTDELSMLDEYEWKPVLKRTRISKIRIGNSRFSPEHLTFYAGTESTDDLTSEEKAERAEFLKLNREPGCLSPQAKWQRNVRCG